MQHIYFETNVGAGLPVIGTLNDLLRSGDKIRKIEAVLSGTLNFVFNHYDGKTKFATVVKQAQDEGYTEPDPRLDLSGTDVMRKIMILAREAGHAIEMEDISNQYFSACFLYGRVCSGFLYWPWKKKKRISKNCLRQRQQKEKN